MQEGQVVVRRKCNRRKAKSEPSDEVDNTPVAAEARIPCPRPADAAVPGARDPRARRADAALLAAVGGPAAVPQGTCSPSSLAADAASFVAIRPSEYLAAPIPQTEGARSPSSMRLSTSLPSLLSLPTSPSLPSLPSSPLSPLSPSSPSSIQVDAMIPPVVAGSCERSVTQILQAEGTPCPNPLHADAMMSPVVSEPRERAAAPIPPTEGRGSRPFWVDTVLPPVVVGPGEHATAPLSPAEGVRGHPPLLVDATPPPIGGTPGARVAVPRAPTEGTRRPRPVLGRPGARVAAPLQPGEGAFVPSPVRADATISPVIVGPRARAAASARPVEGAVAPADATLPFLIGSRTPECQRRVRAQNVAGTPAARQISAKWKSAEEAAGCGIADTHGRHEAGELSTQVRTLSHVDKFLRGIKEQNGKKRRTSRKKCRHYTPPFF
mmetsp:Transcript_12205/g.24322  ORF Transcript_12205/g.24322 Transcript_12205/m.24322 type:complete len:437 (+) Transcript_12205:3-1313(+)